MSLYRSAALAFWNQSSALLKRSRWFRRLSKSPFYGRMRQRIPVNLGDSYVDDSDIVRALAPPVLIDWPSGIRKPRVGIVRDYGDSPWWTKYVRFLQTNTIEFELYNVHTSNWLEKSKEFQLILGIPSSTAYHLEEVRRKYYVLEKHQKIPCYPSFEETLLYEDKILELYLSQVYGFPFAETFATNDLAEALNAVQELPFPVVSKMVPCAGSLGVELIRSARKCRRIIKAAFSNFGRKTHVHYFREKNRVYLQRFLPNDGYDLRIIIVGKSVFGYFRKVPRGDFRASGMNLVEWRSLPLDAMRLATSINRRLQFPMLVVDMVGSSDGGYKIIEISPRCQVDPNDEVQVNGQSGRYVVENNGSYRFDPGKVWIPELVLKEVLENLFLKRVLEVDALASSV